MNHEEFASLAGLLSKISYALYCEDNVSEEVSELLREIWIRFDHYEERD